MEGEVGVSDDPTFARLITAVRPVLEACGSAIKIVVPPLPRYLYTGCCNNKSHCTNLNNADYELRMLQDTMHFRPLLKDAILLCNADPFFVLDGIGALLGIPAGNNRGTAAENLKELKKYCTADGVHFNELGYANIARVISSAVTGIETGTLTKSDTGSGNFSGAGRAASYFWRGFTSPMGYTGPRNLALVTVNTANSHTANNDTGSYTGNEIAPGFSLGGSRGGSRGGGQLRGYRKVPYWKKKF
jgi:hypothetical protein